jgi:Uma2 family endonuclease
MRLLEKGECDAMLDIMFDPQDLQPERVRGLSRGEYDQLVQLGLFENERVELLRGVLVTMSPQGKAHAGLTYWLAKRLTLALGERWEVRSHSPFAASDDSEPEPDISVSAARANPMSGHPSTAVLVIEVSDSSILKDRRVKAPIYAQAGVSEYWLVDISGGELCVEIHSEPSHEGFRRVEVLRAGDVLRPIALPEIEIAVSEIPSAG